MEEFENPLSSQELLAKQMAGVSIKKGEENALVSNKSKFKGKTERDRPKSRFKKGSIPLGKKEELSNYYGKKPLRCFRCGNIGHIKRYFLVKESNMAQKVAEEEEDWEQCLAPEARAVDVMIFINIDKDGIEDLEYVIAVQMENQ